jgi:hypothetical protein
MYRFSAAVLGSMFMVATIGCSVSPQPIPIHESSGLLVELAYDPHAGSGHTHPTTVTAAQLATILHGIQLRGRDVAGAFGLLGDDHNSPALTDRDIAALTPHLAAGLAKASPMDLVTFHLTQRDSQRAPLITSGGLFQRNQHLYIILANARTSPSSIQYETTYEPNSRINPLLPIARFRFATGYLPADWRVVTEDAKRADGWDGYLDESKVVVVDLQRLAKSLPHSSIAAPIVPPAVRP